MPSEIGFGDVFGEIFRDLAKFFGKFGGKIKIVENSSCESLRNL